MIQMTNLLAVLPDFDVSPFSHILPSLERHLITTADLLSLDARDVAKRAQVPPTEVKKLADALIASLHHVASVHWEAHGDEQHKSDGGWLGLGTGDDIRKQSSIISTLDDNLDSALRGGIARGHLTEIVGESAAGKTQFLLVLLLAAQIPNPASTGKHAEHRTALYISTEAPLQTTRLTQILKSHPRLATLPPKDKPSLSRVHSTHIHDLEAQEHILRYQVPVAIKKHNVGLLVIDSIAANYRAEFDKGGQGKRSAESLTQRASQLAQTGALLRGIAREHNVAVVVANQVADRFTSIEPTPYLATQSTQNSRPGTPQNLHAAPYSASQVQHNGPLSTDDPLALDHQQRFFTGWGDDPAVTNLKTPSLGLTWTNQLSTRIALLKAPIYQDKAYAPGDERNLIGWRRTCKPVFSSWSGEGYIPFEIWEGGIRSLAATENSTES